MVSGFSAYEEHPNRRTHADARKSGARGWCGSLGRKMKRMLASSKLLLWLTVISLVAGAALSVHFRDFDWLSRFGALVICWGILLLARPSFTGREIGEHVIAHDSELSLFDPKYYMLKGEAVPDWVTDNVLSRRATGVYGPLVCFLGTLTNGFASLLNGLTGFAP